MSGKGPGRGIVAAAVGYQWFYNGANYLAFKVGVAAMPPFLFSTFRFAAAALLILPLAAWRLSRGSRPTWCELAAAAMIGIIMLVGSQAVAIWGVQHIPAGVAAVFGSAAPLFIALFAWALLHEPLRGRQLAGIATGFVGLALMGWSASGSGEFRIAGVVALLGAGIAWAGGSLWAERLTMPSDPVVALAAQLVTAGIVLSLITAVRGDLAAADLASVPVKAWASLAFLVFASTLIGYAVFLWLNRAVSVSVANTFFYVAPVIAMGLAALILGEPLTWMKGVAAAVALLGVALMLTGARQPTSSRPH